MNLAGTALVVLAGAVAACSEATTDPKVPVSISFDSLPSPSVVVGDTLRNGAGIAAPLVARAFNFRGELITGVTFRYFAADRGVRVDSLTGIVVGDSIRSTPPRVTAVLGTIQALRTLDVTLRPDRVVPANGRDSLQYSVTDSTRNTSRDLTVTVQHLEGLAASPVRSWPVTFEITSPRDTLTAKLVSEAGKSSTMDTTDATGTAGRRITVRATRLASVRDSVIVLASVKYRGAHVTGSPLRLVLLLRP